MDILDRYSKLVDLIDRRFATLCAVHATVLRCRAGCSHCCRARLSVPHVEAASMRQGLAMLPADVRARLAGRAADVDREYCPGLDEAGCCEIYPLRPLICRTIGVPLLHESDVPLIRPPVVDGCDRNFTPASLRLVPAAATLNYTTLHRRLTAVDTQYCADEGLDPYERVPLARVLVQSASKPIAL